MSMPLPATDAPALATVAQYAEALPGGAAGRRLPWLGNSSTAAPGAPPFTFRYGGQASDRLLATWPRRVSPWSTGGPRRQCEVTWSDPAGRLVVRWVIVRYDDFPAVEWTVYLSNAGQAPTEVVDALTGLTGEVALGTEPSPALHTLTGDYYDVHGYEAVDRALAPGAKHAFAPAGGRACDRAWPYFRLSGPGSGLYLAVGWPAQWSATFERGPDGVLHLSAGQQQTHFRLQPGETARTPLIALLWHTGSDAAAAQNLWRRWMLAHNVPRLADGRTPPPLLFGNTSLEFNEMTQANEENQCWFIQRYLDEGIKLDYWWMDAGWYPCGGEWWRTGTWQPDAQRFPRGLRAVSDYGRQRGVKTLVWFEPERVVDGTELARDHADWLLGSAGGNRLLDLGRPAARQWLTDRVDQLLTEQGIGLYRQDHNFEPLGYWRAHDTPERQGLTENFHVQGYLAYWDELRRRHPGLLIDSCASGGRRNDLETMRRSIPLHPTDYNYEHHAAKQVFHQALFEWLPCYGSNTNPISSVNPYMVRSGYGPEVVIGYDLRGTVDLGTLRRLLAEWRELAPYYGGDFYPLLPPTLSERDWCAWQFHRPEQHAGVLQVFRRAQSAYRSVELSLHGLEPATRYEVTDRDAGRTVTRTGAELAKPGLTVELTERPGSAVLWYRAAR